MWTPPALASEARAWAGDLWRLVESQSQFTTLKLVDTVDEQALLEAELEGSKPLIPASCAHLSYLLAMPFRYAPYRNGSRFRRGRQTDGCFYAAEEVETAVAEAAFYNLLFFLDAPTARRPSNPQERSAICVPAGTSAAIDLTEPPLNADAPIWEHPTNYGPCQDLADVARKARIEMIRYRSIRDPRRRFNLALLSPAAFWATQPTKSQTWHIFIRENSVQAIREMPRDSLEIHFSVWATDPRVPMQLLR